jgi:hypothetical protein
MDSLRLANLEIDDAIKHHGSVGVDLWTINDKSATLISTLSLDDTKQLAKWLLNYLAKYDKH